MVPRFLLFAVGVVLGCARPGPVQMPDGRIGWYVESDAELSCLDKAAAHCLDGYKVITHEIHQVPAWGNNRFGVNSYYPVAFTTDTGDRESMIVVCKPPPRPGACRSGSTRCLPFEEDEGQRSQPQVCDDDGEWRDSDVVCDRAAGLRCVDGSCVGRR